MAYKQSPGRSPFQKTGRGIPLNFLSPLHNHEKGHKEADPFANETKGEMTAIRRSNPEALKNYQDQKRNADNSPGSKMLISAARNELKDRGYNFRDTNFPDPVKKKD